MKQKKVMRGVYWWILLVLCIFWLAKTIVEIFNTGFAEVMNSNSGWGLIVPVLYFAAWFIVPPLYQKLFVGEPVNRTVPTAAENTRLEAPAVLTIHRKSSPMGALLPFDITLNGLPTCTLKNGESAQITLTMTHNVLILERFNSSKARCEFDAPSGGIGTIDLGYGEFKTKTLQWKNEN